MSNSFIIYPIHIDSSISLNSGRKYSIKNSIPSPKLIEIKSAVEKLQIEHFIEKDKIHPKEKNDRFGRLKILCSRNIGIPAIVETIKEEREIKKKLQEKSEAVPNLLNLVPRKKNKSKKK